MGRPERQVSFAGGELSPMLYGRTDLDRYPSGARTLLNFIVTQHGPVVNRSGTQHVDDLEILGAGIGETRLYPFVVSETVSFVLAFYAEGVRVISEQRTGLPFPPYMIAGTTTPDARHRFYSWTPGGCETPYAAADLFGLRFAQVGSILYIASENHPFASLTYSGGEYGTFTYEEVSFQVPDFPGLGNPGYDVEPRVHVGITGETNVSGTPTLYSLAGNGSHPALEWTWQVTRVMRSSDGTVYETAPFEIIEQFAETDESGEVQAALDNVTTGERAVYEDWPQRIKLQTLPVNVGHLDDTIVLSRIYRGRDGRFGWIGETSGDIFVDRGEEPDYSDPPPQETNPFEVYGYDEDGNEELVRTEYPSVVAIHEGRLLAAATTERPTTVFASAYDDFTNHDEVPLPDARDAFTFRVASLRLDKIQALIPRERLFILTTSAEYLAAGSGDGESMTPTSVAVRQLSEHGSAARPAPVSISSSIFFMQAKGITPRVIVVGEGGVRVLDISLWARHLFDGHTIVDWAYAEHPHSVLWAVRDDGILLSLTYQPEQNVAAWAQHEIADDGLVESVCCKPEALEDGVYLVVNRSGVRSVERLAYRTIDDVEQGIFLDRSVSRQADLDPMMTGEATLSPINGRSITIWSGQYIEYAGVQQGPAWAVYFTDFADYGLAGRAISVAHPTEGEERLVFRIGEWSSADSGYLAELISHPESEELTELIDATYHGSGNQADAGDDFYLLYDSIDGLDHLEGDTVTVVADGDVTTEVTVESGSVALDWPARIVHAGRPYNSDFESLDAIGERGKQKTVSKMMLELEGVRGGSAGSTLEGLVPLRTRTVEEGYGAQGMKRLEGDVVVKDQWRTSGRCAFRQSDPLPCTILGITRELDYGG